MVDNLDKILDECIDRLNRGLSVEACLADYPGYSRQLEPLLRAMLQTRKAYAFDPSEGVKMAAKRRFDALREERAQRAQEKPPWLSRIFGRRLAWAALATTAVAIIAAYFGFNQAFSPAVDVVNPDPEGNFVLLISDDVNAIEDFESLLVSITRVEILPSGDSGERIQFTPETIIVDLTQVKGEATQEIWRGSIPEGEYAKVVLYVDSVEGVLKEAKILEGTGPNVEVKLPSDKLQVSIPFQIMADTVTSFTFDVTVVSAGNEQSGIKYILKPQIGESGADTKPANSRGKGKQE